ncbi:MAG TPA: hypothetical protein VMW53_07430 [archaeon]|nr:hypothetical protein [archaeon]
MKYKYCDGGRKNAGYKGGTDDCGIRAVAIATDTPYQIVYDAINLLAKSERPRKSRARSNARKGVWRRTLNKYLETLGWKWKATMGIGTGCTIHLRSDELPTGRIIARVSKHYVAVINGVIHDTFDPSRNGTRCIYGYWQKTK